MKTIIMGVMLLFMSAAGWFILYKVAVAKYPNLLSINKSAEQITQPSPNPVVIPTKEPTKSPVVNTKAANKPSQIDCVGPDGVHFKTTQVECDNFNNAWNKPQPTPQPSSANYYYPYSKTYPLYIPPPRTPYPTVQLLPTIPPYQPLPTRPPANVYWHPNPPAPTVPYGFSN